MRRAWLPGLLVATFISATSAAVAAAEALPVHWTCNGSDQCEDRWWTSPVFLDWTIDPPASGNCPDVTISDDTPGVTVTCQAVEGPATITVPLTIKVDRTPPDVGEARPARPPDHAGWYTHPVAFSATASDATSGLDTCDPVTYSGPDSADGRVAVRCRDNAGNSSLRAFPLRYDATPPDASTASLTTGDRVVRLAWPAGADAQLVRTPGTGGSFSVLLYEGTGGGLTDRRVRNGRTYRYVLTLRDQAGNVASRELVAVPDRRLIAPARRAVVGGPPLLTWTAVRGARYYNVQLFRRGRKILSAWPTRAQLQLKQRWRFRGRRYRLKPAKYRWYVWPGKGRRAANRYGKRIGGRSFTVMPRS